MFAEPHKVKNFKRTNALFTHSIMNAKKGILSPLNLKSLSRENYSTSPSPLKQECLTPNKFRQKKNFSKLFRKAHETNGRETFLGGGSAIIKFPSSVRGTIVNERNRRSFKDNREITLEIVQVFNICINGPLSLSLIIDCFEEGGKELPGIAENSDEVL